MFEKLKQMAAHRQGGANVDPSVFGDPLALQTSWHRAAAGGASFGTHRLKQTAGHRVEFVPTLAWKLFYLLFIVVGSGILGFHLNRVEVSQVRFASQDTYVPLIVGAVFAAVGICMWWAGATPRVFDQARGMYWRGRKDPVTPGMGRQGDSSTPLSAIHALQLLAEYVSGNKSSYYSYELNLVLGDASRINVVDHGNLEHLRADAQALARFLGKPVWDATRS